MASTENDIELLVDESPLGWFQVRVVILCSFVSLLDGYDLQTMGFLIPTLSAQWSLPPADFRLALSASLIGLAAGALTAGPISDRFGRRRVLLVALVLLMLSTFGSATATGMSAITAWRFATGLGLGASLPNVIALTAEYAPLRYRALMLSLMLCGLPLGGALGGQLAAAVIGPWGWQSLFIVGGIIPLLLLVGMYVYLPESIKFLAGRPGREAEMHRTLARLRTDRPDCTPTPTKDPGIQRTSTPIAGLFRDRRMGGTLLLWAIFFCNLFLLYLLNSWLPTLLRNAGWSIEQALRGAAMFHYGGLAGGLALSWLIDRYSPYRILPPTYLFTFIAVAAIGPAGGHVQLASAVMALAGAGIIGAQFCLNALAAAYYPTFVRATGVGWAHGMGRLGAILSPFAGSYLIAAAWEMQGFFLAAALPAVLCAGFVLAMQAVAGRARA